MSNSILKLLFCVCFLASCEILNSAPERVNPHAALIADFQTRVANYLKLRQQAEKDLRPLKPTDSAERIAEQERALAERITRLRAGAKKGEIFTPPIVGEFRRLLRIAGEGAHASEIRRSLRSAEPVHLALRVNQGYPKSVPLQSTPATVLRNLPALPKQVEYRVIGHDLILRDIGANLVIDFADGVVP